MISFLKEKAFQFHLKSRVGVALPPGQGAASIEAILIAESFFFWKPQTNQPSIEMQSGSPDMMEVKKRMLRMFCFFFICSY